MQNLNLIDTIMTQALLSNKTQPKQQKILESAIKLFAEKGYSNTSTKEIAESAAVAEGTLFRYYTTKETLLLSLIGPFMKEMIPKIAEDLMGTIKFQTFDSFEALLRFFLKNRIEFIQDSGQIFHIFVKELLYQDNFRKKWLPQMNPNVLNYVNEVLTDFKAKGEIKDLPNEVLLRIIGSFIGGYFVSRFMFLPEYVRQNDEEELEALIGLIINGIKN